MQQQGILLQQNLGKSVTTGSCDRTWESVLLQDLEESTVIEFGKASYYRIWKSQL
jgi:hypothetical protein